MASLGLSSFQWHEEPTISGLTEDDVTYSADDRGTFVKVLGGSRSSDWGLKANEIFWSRSSRGVIRGLHLQKPPFHGRKFVWVTEGTIIDVIVDMRWNSPTFGGWTRKVLTAEGPGILVPAGCAHGFEVITEFASVQYVQDCPYSSENDIGLYWASLNIPWSISDPTISDRDLNFPSADDVALALANYTWARHEP